MVYLFPSGVGVGITLCENTFTITFGHGINEPCTWNFVITVTIAKWSLHSNVSLPNLWNLIDILMWWSWVYFCRRRTNVQRSHPRTRLRSRRPSPWWSLSSRCFRVPWVVTYLHLRQDDIPLQLSVRKNIFSTLFSQIMDLFYTCAIRIDSPGLVKPRMYFFAAGCATICYAHQYFISKSWHSFGLHLPSIGPSVY